MIGPEVDAASGRTVVSLTFDDGTDDQAAAVSMMDAHGMKGTFYVNAGRISQPGYLAWDQLAAMAADGHEIGGHTLDHVDLRTVSTSEVTYQVHEDRTRLLKHGFADPDFAYPYGAGWHDPTIRSIVKECGYTSARGAWGLVGPDSRNCKVHSETIPPEDAWAIRTAENPKSTTSLSTIESHVTNAETRGGGWVILVFHGISVGVGKYSTSPATFQALLDWLEPRTTRGTTVEAVNQVLGGDR